jgi:hypothetical protein
LNCACVNCACGPKNGWSSSSWGEMPRAAPSPALDRIGDGPPPNHGPLSPGFTSWASARGRSHG